MKTMSNRWLALLLSLAVIGMILFTCASSLDECDGLARQAGTYGWPDGCPKATQQP